ncbi:Hypothetical protein CFV354_1600 [Campylobacter fetus subsp. venerealis NCTC 10354]|nr:Hypothetical protein CFV354_1600 [Campylobacter fetus subsp. venerealis NCTC 10354]
MLNLEDCISHILLPFSLLRTIAFEIDIFWYFIRLFDDEYLAQNMNSSPPNKSVEITSKQKALATCLYLS